MTIAARRAWALCPVLFALGALFASLGRPTPSAAQAPRPVGAPGFNLLWNRPVGQLASLAISPQGGRIALLTRGGKLCVWSAANGAPIWSHLRQRATDIAITDGIGYVLAYDALNPLDTRLTLLRADNGQVAWQERLDGAVWAAAVSPDGMHAVVSTGQHTIYDCILDPQPSVKKWQAAGICDSLAYAPSDAYVAAGLWNPSGVECFDANGKSLWQYSGRDDRRYDASITPRSRFVTALAYANHRDSDGQVVLIDADSGAPLWTYSLGADSYYVSALGAANAATTIASFARIELQGRTVVEPRQLVALDREGNKIWGRGGLFFSPTLLCLAPHSQGLVVYDGRRTLYLLDDNGDIVNHARMSGLLRKWAVSGDDQYLAIYTGDGQLTLYKLG